jgi:hypothetical protein
LLDTGDIRREKESSSDSERRIVTVGSVGCPIGDDSAVVELETDDSIMIELEKEDSAMVKSEVEMNELEGGRTQAQGESRYGEVYIRIKKQNERVMPTMSLMSSLLLLPTPTPETPIYPH